MIDFIQNKISTKSHKLSVFILLTVFVVAFIYFFVFRVLTVPTGSMNNTIPTGSKILVINKLWEPPLERGDIVVFKPNKQFTQSLFVKRLIGMPGDVVKIDNGQVYINGKELYEPYVSSHLAFPYDKTFHVPKGEYLFLGDNRGNSDDARFWENPYIKYSQIYGIATYCFSMESGLSSLKLK